MFLLTTITAEANSGRITGGAIATIAGTSVAMRTAVGTVTGASAGLFIGIKKGKML